MKRNANVTAAIIQNFEQAEKVLETSRTAMGSATRENEKYMQSIEGRVSKLKAVFEGLSASLISDDFIKSTVSGTTNVLSVVTKIADTIGGIPTTIGLITAGMAGFRVFRGQRTGIFDMFYGTDGKDGTSTRMQVRLFNRDVKAITNGVKEYKTVAQSLKQSGAKGAGFQTFGYAMGSFFTRGNRYMTEYNRLLGEQEKAQSRLDQSKSLVKNARQIGANEKTIEKYNKRLQENKVSADHAKNSLTAYQQTVTQGNTAMQRYIKSLDGQKASFQGYVKYVRDNGGIMKNAGMSILGGVGNVASMFGSAFMSAGISMAVMGVISLITKLVTAQETLRQKTLDASRSFTESKSNLQSYASEIASINDSLSSGTLSVEETMSARERLVQIQGELRSAYGSEADGLNLLTMSATEATAALEQLAATQARTYRDDNEKGIRQANEEMNRDRSFMEGFRTPDSKKEMQDLVDLAEDFDSFTIDWSDNMQGFGFHVRGDVRTAMKDIKEFQSRAKKLGIDLGAISTNYLFGDNRSLDDFLNTTYKSYEGIYTKFGETQLSDFESLIQENEDLLAIQNSLTKAQNEYNDATAKTYGSDEERTESVSKAIDNLKAVQDAINSADFDGNDALKNYMQDMLDVAMKTANLDAFKIELKDENVSDRMKTLLNTLNQFQDENGKLNLSDILNAEQTNPDAWNALNAACGAYGLTLQQVLEEMGNVGRLNIDTNAFAYDAGEKFKEMSTGIKSVLEEQDVLNGALQEQATNGTISLDTYNGLIAYSKDFAGALVDENGAMTINAEAAQKLVKLKAQQRVAEMELQAAEDQRRKRMNDAEISELEAMNELTTAQKQRLAVLKSENQAIEETAVKYQIQVAALQQATSAYAQWQNAQQTANEDTMYKNLYEARKQITEGLKSGKTGTDDFKASVKLLIPDAPSSSDKKAIQSYMWRLNRYLTVNEETGETTKTGINNFLADAMSKKLKGGRLMQKNADGSYEFLEGVTAQDIVERLEITPAMAQAIFKNLETYDIKIKNAPEDTDWLHLEYIQDTKNELGKLNKEVDKINQNTDYEGPGRTEAISEVTKGYEDTIKGLKESYESAVGVMNRFQPGTESFNSAREKAQELLELIDSLPPEVKMTMDIDDKELKSLMDPGHMDPVQIPAELKVKESEGQADTPKAGFDFSETIKGVDDSDVRKGLSEHWKSLNGDPLEVPVPVKPKPEVQNDAPSEKEIHDALDAPAKALQEAVENAPPVEASQDVNVDVNVNSDGEGLSSTDIHGALDAPRNALKAAIENNPVEATQTVNVKTEVTSDGSAGSGGEGGSGLGEKIRSSVGSIVEKIMPGLTQTATTAVSVQVDANVELARAKIAAISTENITIPVDADDSIARGKIAAIQSTPIVVPVNANVAQAHAQMASLQTWPVTVNVQANLASAQAQIAGLGWTAVSVEVYANVSMARAQIAGLGGTAVSVDVSLNVANAQAQLNSLTPPTITIPAVTTDISPASAGLTILTTKAGQAGQAVSALAARRIGDLGAGAAAGALSAVAGRLSAISGLISSLNGRTINIVTKYTTIGSPPSASGGGTRTIASGAATAFGTPSASGGTTLVGELGPEMRVSNGQFQIVGAHGAEFVNLNRGDIVFNHQDTKRLLAGLNGVRGTLVGMSALTGRAMADGGIVPGGWKDRNVNFTVATAVDVTMNDKNLEEKLKDKLSKVSEELEYILNRYETKIFENQANRGDYHEVVAYYKQMQEQVHAYADKYRAMGLSDNSKTVNALKKQWFELRDKIRDAITGFYDDLIQKSENAVELSQNHMESLEARATKGWLTVSRDVPKIALGIKHSSEELEEANRSYQETLATLSAQDEFDPEGFAELAKAYSRIKEAEKSLAEFSAMTPSDLGYFDKILQDHYDIVNQQKEIQKLAHEAADYMRSVGFEDSSEEVSKYVKQWWSAESAIKEATQNIIDYLNELVTSSSGAIDDLQSAFENFTTAAEEYAKNGGFISIDTFQEILELGPQYLNYLEDENGLLKINRESIEKVMKARIQDLGVMTALNYVERLRLAAAGESEESLESLLYATNLTTDATWELVYAQLELAGLKGEYLDRAKNIVDRMYSLTVNTARGVGSTLAGDAEKYAESMGDIIKYTMDMLEQRMKDQVDQIEDMVDSYEKLIDAKKESLRATKEENEYQKSLQEKTKEMAKLQEQIAALSMDDSREAQAKKAKLLEDVSQLQDQIAEAQANQAYDAQVDALDKMADNYKEQKDEEIKALEKTLSSEEKRYQAAIDYIQNNWNTLYSELIDWNTEYGNDLNLQVTEAWNSAAKAVEHYGGVVAAVQASTYANYGGSGTAYGAGTDASGNPNVVATMYGFDPRKVAEGVEMVHTMQANSFGWLMADNQKERDEYAAENLKIGNDLRKYDINAERRKDGDWYLAGTNTKLYDMYDKYKKDHDIGWLTVGQPIGVKLEDFKLAMNGGNIASYHSGGIAGAQPTMKQDEVMAILQKGEAVLDKKKESTLFKIIDFASVLSEKLGVAMKNVDSSIFSSVSRNSLIPQHAGLGHIMPAGPTINFGDTYIYGTNDETVRKHQEISRGFVNDVLDKLNIRR